MMAGRTRLLLTTDTVGGVWQYAIELARAVAPLGVETVLALMGPASSRAHRATAATIPGARLVDTGLGLDWLASNPAAVAAAGRRITELAGDERVDIVQLNMPALAAEARFAVPVVAVAHSCVGTWWDAMHGTDLPGDFAWRTALVRAGLHKADLVVAPSAAFAVATMHAHGLKTRPVVVHNGRSPLPLRAAAMHDFAFTAGRLWDKGKNIVTLDRAAARLAIPCKAAGPIHGPNGEFGQFDNLHLLGEVSEAEIARSLSAKPVFVSAARYEPFGLAVLEAAAAGCPLVLSDIPTFRELWDGAAVFVASADDRGFADAIDDIIGDTSQRLALGQAARARAARYTPAAMAAGMVAIYDRLAAPPRAAASRPRVAA